MAVDDNYKKVLELCKVLIDREYRSCGLEKNVLKRIYSLTILWTRCKERQEREGISGNMGGLANIFRDLEAAVERAHYWSKRTGKPKCYYLSRGLKRKPTETGGLGRYFIAFIPDWCLDFLKN